MFSVSFNNFGTPARSNIFTELEDGLRNLTVACAGRPRSCSPLGNRHVEVLSTSPASPNAPHETGPASSSSMGSGEPNLTDAWNSLQAATDTDASIPKKTVYPQDYGTLPDASHLTPIENTQTGEPWNLCANWMTNPHDPDQRIAVFQYPHLGEVEEYWTLFYQHELENIVDLTQERDHPGILIFQQQSQFYPPNDDRWIVRQDPDAEEPQFYLRCKAKNGKIASYQCQIPSSEEFETKVYHYEDWEDGDAINMIALDQLVDYVLQCEKIGIHCKAGVGRTGTLTTAVFIKHLIKTGKIQKDAFTPEWLIDFVLALRRQRSKDWVQNPCQFELLYQYGRALLNQ